MLDIDLPNLQRMKTAIIALSLAVLLSIGSEASAQKAASSKAKVTKQKKPAAAAVKKAADEQNDMEDAASTGVNPVRSENPDDPLYMNHPYFNGEPRWSHVDSLYKHGDFPWAMVNKNPENFRFNPETGMWEMLQTPNLGKSNQTR
jgi:hypothetical protein